MSDQRRYARVYHELRIVAYEVYGDGALLGAWLQLLLEADTAWPEPGQLPREVDVEQYERLCELGEVLPGPRPYTFRVKRLELSTGSVRQSASARTSTAAGRRTSRSRHTSAGYGRITAEVPPYYHRQTYRLSQTRRARPRLCRGRLARLV